MVEPVPCPATAQRVLIACSRPGSRAASGRASWSTLRCLRPGPLRRRRRRSASQRLQSCAVRQHFSLLSLKVGDQTPWLAQAEENQAPDGAPIGCFRPKIDLFANKFAKAGKPIQPPHRIDSARRIDSTRHMRVAAHRGLPAAKPAYSRLDNTQRRSRHGRRDRPRVGCRREGEPARGQGAENQRGCNDTHPPNGRTHQQPSRSSRSSPSCAGAGSHAAAGGVARS